MLKSSRQIEPHTRNSDGFAVPFGIPLEPDFAGHVKHRNFYSLYLFVLIFVLFF